MKTYKYRSKTRTPGRGKHLDGNVLKAVVLYSFKHRPCEIETNMKVSHGVATRIPMKIRELQLTADEVNSMTGAELKQLWYQRSSPHSRNGDMISYLEPDLEAMQAEYLASREHDGSRTAIKVEQTHANVVRSMYLTEENQQKAEASGKRLYSESHVLRLWREHEKKITPIFRRSYPMGYAAEMDFTGITIPYTENSTHKNATLLVMVLPASRMMAVKAIASQKAEHVCPGIAECFQSYGALPDVLVVDNYKAGVDLPSKYGGQISAPLNTLAHYFGLEVVTSRPYMPTDKGAAEAAVKITNRFIGASLASKRRKGHEYHSLEEINRDIKPLVDRINARKVRGLNKSRKDLFTEEKMVMRIPIAWDYHYPNCLVEQRIPDTAIYTFRGHQYALPPKWCGSILEVEVVNQTINFYSNGSFITTYKRKDEEPGLSTHDNYTPEEYLAAECFEVQGVEALLQSWAKTIGPHVSSWLANNFSRKAARFYRNHTGYGVLMLPGCNIADYRTFDQCVGECMATCADFPSYARIKQVWEKKPHSEVITPDKVFNPENFRACCRNYMLNKTHALCWPVSQLNGEAHSYLRGQAEMQQRYAELEKQLGECHE